MEYETLKLEIQENIAYIAFNRLKALNSFNSKMLRESVSILEKCQSDENIKVLVFKGAGDKAFSVGADIAEVQNYDSRHQLPYLRNWIKMLSLIEEIPKPVIASVHGYALGGGAEFCLCCDIVMAGKKAKFGFPEIKIGVIPGAGGPIRLTRWIGKSKAVELLMTGDIIDANEAYLLGLVNRVVPWDRLNDKTLELAKKLSSRPPLALAALKRSVNIGSEMDRDKGIEYALNEALLLFDSHDQKEGMKAFLEKREPNFIGQ